MALCVDQPPVGYFSISAQVLEWPILSWRNDLFYSREFFWIRMEERKILRKCINRIICISISLIIIFRFNLWKINFWLVYKLIVFKIITLGIIDFFKISFLFMKRKFISLTLNLRELKISNLKINAHLTITESNCINLNLNLIRVVTYNFKSSVQYTTTFKSPPFDNLSSLIF